MSVSGKIRLAMDSAQAIVNRVFAGQTVASVSIVHGGEIAAVYEIAFAELRPAVILKVYPDSLHWKMQKEVNVIALLQGRVGVSVPQILLADDSQRLLDLNFVLMTKLDGSILRRLEPTLSSNQQTSVYLQIGQLLREFHRIPMDAFGYIGPNGIWTAHSTSYNYLSFQFDKKLKEFSHYGGAPVLAQRIGRYVAERAHLLEECSDPVLCHNDLHSGNLIADTSEGRVRLTGVLDFEGALAGDPLMDVAKAIYYLGNETKNALLQGYGDTERRLWPQTLDFFRLYFALELWCWMAQIGDSNPRDDLERDLERLSTL
jgi:hygromycin-B 7''-O-kinase